MKMSQGKRFVGNFTLHGEMLRQDKTGEHSRRLHLLITKTLDKQMTIPHEYRHTLVEALLSCARVIDVLSQKYRSTASRSNSGGII